MATKDLVTEKLDAQFHEAEARLDLLQARAEGRKAKEDMDEISGLRAARERTKQKFADLKQKGTEQRAATRREAEAALHEFQAGLKRAGERFAAWDEASDRRLTARLYEAESKLRIWQARTDEKHAERAMKRHDALASLEQRIALARARAAERRLAAHSEKAAEALEEAARHFDEAYDATVKLYDKQ